MTQTPPPTAIETASDERLREMLATMAQYGHMEHASLGFPICEVKALITELLSRRSLDTADRVEPKGWFDYRGTVERVSAILTEFGMPPEGEVDQFEWLRETLASRTRNTETVVKAERKELEAAADAALQALEDWHHVNIAEFTGWGDGEVPQGAEDNLQTVKNARAALASPPAQEAVTIWPLEPMAYMKVHDAAQAAYEAATPPDYRYSAIALRKAVDAGITEALQLGKEG